MALTRKLLKGMGLTDEQVDTIIEAHTETVDGLKEQVETYKADAEKLTDVQKELDTLKATGGGELAQQFADLQAKYDTETQQYKNQIADRDYSDAVTRAIAGQGIKFSSKAAEKAYISDLKANRLELKDGALVGFDDYHKAQVEADPSAFQSDKPAPVFVKPIGAGGPPAAESKGAMYAKQFNAQYAPTNTKE